MLYLMGRFLRLVPLIVFLAACGGGSDSETESVTPTIDLTSAVAVATSSISASKNASIASKNSTQNSNVYKITSTGEVEIAGTNLIVSDLVVLSGGLVAHVISGDSSRTFWIDRSDSSMLELEFSDNERSVVKGQNLNGDVIFWNADVFDVSERTMVPISSSLDDPRVQSVSGNFAILTDNTTFQIYDTTSGTRYNVAGCNGPQMVAINTQKALINDCSANELIDMSDGSRTDVTGMFGWNHETLETAAGAVILSQGFSGLGGGYHLGRVDSSGTLTMLYTTAVSPGSGSCMNCGDPNKVLFEAGNYFVLKELSQITIVQDGIDAGTQVLSGYNIIDVSMNDDEEVFFVAEDSQGNPVVGKYVILTDTTVQFIAAEELTTIKTLVD